jgi:hypothetical protein
MLPKNVATERNEHDLMPEMVKFGMETLSCHSGYIFELHAVWEHLLTVSKSHNSKSTSLGDGPPKS